MIYILFLVHLSLIRYPPYVPEPGFDGIQSTAATCLQRSAGKRVMGVAQIHNTPRSAQLMVAELSDVPVDLGTPTEC